MSSLFLKYVHIVCVAASFALFFVRGLWIIRSYPQSQERWARILPHVVDTALVISAVWLLFSSPQKGWPGDWLTIKLLLIAAYVALAQYVFHVARGLVTRMLLWVMALLVFLFVTTVAVLHDPRGILVVL